TGGQVWQFDFSQPGLLNAGSLAQWTGQRLFVSAAYQNQPDANNTLNKNEYPYRPMFQIVSAAASRDFKNLWVFVGTGDRDLLASPSLNHTSGVTLDAAIPDIVCGRSPYDDEPHANRIYALEASRGRAIASTPNTETNLTALND